MRGKFPIDGLFSCTRCKKTKPVAAFCKSSVSACGLDSRCRQCHQERTGKPPPHRLDHSSVNARRLYHSAKARSKEKGIPFTITPADIRIPERCPLLDTVLAQSLGSSGPSPNSPTLDRIDSTKGYEPGNVWVVSYRANAIKNDATLEELLSIAENLYKRTTYPHFSE